MSNNNTTTSAVVAQQVKEWMQSPFVLATGASLITFGLLDYMGVFHEKFQVPHGHAAIRINKLTGNPRGIIYTEGTHYCLKRLDQIVTFDIRVQTLEVSGLFKSADKKPVGLDFQIQYQITPQMLPKLYTAYTGLDKYSKVVLENVAQQITKQIIGSYTAMELASSKKSDFAHELQSKLTHAISQHQPVVVSVVDFVLSSVTLSRDMMELLSSTTDRQ